MKTQRRFRAEFKRQAIEELLSGISSPAQIIRGYEISSGLLYHWKEQCAKGVIPRIRPLLWKNGFASWNS